jgi:hypothetical protein
MVKSRGPAAPAKEGKVGQITIGACMHLQNLVIKLVHKPQDPRIEKCSKSPHATSGGHKRIWALKARTDLE